MVATSRIRITPPSIWLWWSVIVPSPLALIAVSVSLPPALSMVR